MEAAHQRSATLAFCFTDIVDSTRLWEETAEMAPALRLHDQILRDTFAEHGGEIFSITGDGFGASFAVPDHAVRAAVLVQQRLAAAAWPPGAEISVRVGIHIGQAEQRDGNFFGPPVNQSARLMSAANGHQILISEELRRVLHEWPADGTVPIGSLQLKGIHDPIIAHSIRAPGVRVASGAGIAASPAQLPSEITSIVGRDETIASVVELLRTRRLLSIVGVGGVGKTTIATEIARREVDHSLEACIVSLGRVDRSDDLDLALSNALGLPDNQTIDAIVDGVLAERPILLVFDNCEHLVGEVAQMVRTLLDRTSRVRVLATSRERLHVPGEQVVSLAPLATVANGSESAAVTLFRRRAEEAGATFKSPNDLQAINDLCVHLDGLPLAIELCAAKASLLRPADLLRLLEGGYGWLKDDRAGSETRHQTLESTFAWSYDLLAPLERTVFDQLSVFVGPFDLDDAVEVCAVDGHDQQEVLNAVLALVERSLVQRNPEGVQFRMLEALREFAREHHRASDSEPIVRRRHAERFAAVAKRVDERFIGPQSRDMVQLVVAHTSNFEAAVKWAIDADEIDLAIGIVADLLGFGLQFGWRHGPTWLSQILDNEPDPQPTRWAELLAAAGVTAIYQLGAARRALNLADRAIAIDERSSPAWLVRAHVARSVEESEDAANELMSASQHSSSRPGARHWEMTANVYLGFAALRMGDVATATHRGRRLQVLGAAWEDESTTGWGRYLVARAQSPTDPARAIAALADVRHLAVEERNTVLEISVRRQYISALIDSGEIHTAELELRSLLTLVRDLGELDQARRVAQIVAITRAMSGDDDVAARLIGRLGVPRRNPHEYESYEIVVEALRERMGDGYEPNVEIGRATSVDVTVRLAANALPTPTAPDGSGTPSTQPPR